MITDIFRGEFTDTERNIVSHYRATQVSKPTNSGSSSEPDRGKFECGGRHANKFFA
jgi:hypothetical protein